MFSQWALLYGSCKFLKKLVQLSLRFLETYGKTSQFLKNGQYATKIMKSSYSQ